MFFSQRVCICIKRPISSVKFRGGGLYLHGSREFGAAMLSIGSDGNVPVFVSK